MNLMNTHFTFNKDTNWLKLRNGSMDWSIFQKRSKALHEIRSFFDNHDFLELESPILTPFPTLDNNILSVQADVTTLSGKCLPLYLHTSPEHTMKKYLVAGAEKIYFLGKVFRNGEITRLHNPEFTMVEWYRTQATYEDVMHDTECMIQHLFSKFNLPDQITYSDQAINLNRPWRRVSVYTLFKEKVGIDLDEAQDVESLKKQAKHLECMLTKEDDWESCFYKIFLDYIENGLGVPEPAWVTDYPKRLGLMARTKKHAPEYVERAELYIAGLELANGYSELVDPVEQRARFVEDQAKKKAMGFDYPIDEELLHALELGLPSCSGMALGFDRLFMLLTNQTSIEDVLTFPINQFYNI